MRFCVRAGYGGDEELAECLVRLLAANSIDSAAAVSVLHAPTIAIGDSRLIPSLDAYLLLHADAGTEKMDVRALLAIALSGICAKAHVD
jgi:hypothetical protein